MADPVEDQIIAIVRRAIHRPDAVITHETALADLGLESLDMVEMLFFIEDEFRIDVPYNAGDSGTDVQFATVGDIVAGVKTLVANKVSQA